MLAFPLLLATVFSAPTAQPANPVSPSGVTPWGTAATAYKCFTGTSFPSQFLPFDELWSINQGAISQGNSAETVANIKSAIQTVSQQAQPPVSPSLILAQIMQESGGDLSRTGDNGKSVGLMQVQLHSEAPITCDPGACTLEKITGMLQQSILGHSGSGAPASPGIAYDLENNSVGAALRVYNTGHLVDPNNFQAATPCSTSSYVSDIANRLLGLWPQGMLDPQELQSQCGFPPATIC